MSLTTITIDDDILDEILFEVDAKLVQTDIDDITLEDLALSKEDLINRICLPAVRTYLRYAPLILKTEHLVSENFSIDFPQDNITGIISHTFNGQTQIGRLNQQGIYANAFYRNSIISQQGSGLWGGVNDYNMRIAQQEQFQSRQSLINTKRNTRVDLDRINKKVTGFTNQSPMYLTIKWALTLSNFNDIPISDIDLVMNLCKANLLTKISNSRSQIAETGFNEFSSDDFKARAESLREEAMTELKERTKVTILGN